MKMNPLVKGQILTAIKDPANIVICVDDSPKQSDFKNNAERIDYAVNNLKNWMALISPDGTVLLELCLDVNRALLFDDLGDSFLKIKGEKIAIGLDDMKDIAAVLEDSWDKKGKRLLMMSSMNKRQK